MRVKIVKAIGLNTDQQAAQTAVLVRDNENIFLGVLSIISDDAFTKGRQLLSELGEGFFNPDSLNLEDSLNAGEKLIKIFSLAREKLAGAEKVDLLLGSISGKVLYLIAEGDVVALLKRDINISPLLQIGQSASLISGFLKEGDLIYLSTTALKEFLGDNFEKSLEMDIDSWEEEITSRIGAAGVNDGLAGLLSYVQPEPKKEEEKEVFEKEDHTPGLPLKERIKIGPILNKLSGIFPRSGKIRLILGVILLLVVLAGVGLKIKNSQDRAQVLAFKQQLQEAKANYEAALGLKNLNPKEAKEKLDSSKAKIDQALVTKPGDPEAVELKKKIEADGDSILQQFKQAEFPVYLDLNLIKKDLKPSKMSLSVGTLLLLDDQSKSLVSIDLSKKSNQVLAGSSQLGEARSASLNGSFAFVLSSDKGLIRVDATNKKTTVIAAKNEDWGEIVDISGFASNVYLLDIKNNKILKYVPTSSGYSDGQDYFSKDTKADLSGSLRMQIESSVYVLKQGGEILRFTKGVKDNFSLSGLDKGINNPKSIFISSDTENLYILDSGNSRLVVTSKIGEYKSQYGGDKFAIASDLVVDEKGKKVYILEGSSIYLMDLK